MSYDINLYVSNKMMGYTMVYLQMTIDLEKYAFGHDIKILDLEDDSRTRKSDACDILTGALPKKIAISPVDNARYHYQD